MRSLFWTIALFANAQAFQHVLSAQQPSTKLYSSEKEVEIAKLEEQLRQLKEEQATEERITAANNGEEAVEVVPESMFLSEGWKEEDAVTSSEGSLFGNILKAVGVAVFLVLFSQIPIGQEDLSKYSAIKAPTETIDLGDLNRARQSGDI